MTEVIYVYGTGLVQTNSGQGPKIVQECIITVIVGAVVFSGLMIAGFYILAG